MKAVSGNFTLSHACSHVDLPRANSLPVSAAERAWDAPSGDAGIKQVAQVGGGWTVVTARGRRGGFVVLNAAVKSGAQTETVHPHPEGLFRVTDLGVLKLRLTLTGSSAHLVASMT